MGVLLHIFRTPFYKNTYGGLLLDILTLSWRMSLSYRNQFIDLLCKWMERLLYCRVLRHERVNWQELCHFKEGWKYLNIFGKNLSREVVTKVIDHKKRKKWYCFLQNNLKFLISHSTCSSVNCFIGWPPLCFWSCYAKFKFTSNSTFPRIFF